MIQTCSVLKESLWTTLDFYNHVILSKLRDKNRKWVISSAIALSLIYFVHNRILRPPKKLRHLPSTSPFKVVLSALKNESLFEYNKSQVLPILHQENSSGLYTRLGPNGWEVCICNPEDAKQVLFKLGSFPKAEIFTQNKGTLANRFSVAENIFLANGHNWKTQRSIANPAFHRSMPVNMFGELSKTLFETMDKMGDTIEVTNLFRRFTLDAIGRAGFGFDFNATVDPNSKWVVCYDDINVALQDPLFFLFPVLEQKFLWMFPKRKAVHHQLSLFLKMMDDVIVNKRQEIQAGNTSNKHLNESEKDILTLLIEAEQRGEGVMTDEVLKGNLCFFFLAGHDTTTNALSFAVYYLATHSDVQERARKEALTILGEDPVDIMPTLEQTKAMTYLNQIMKETLRLQPPAPRVFPRTIQEDTVLSGTMIPNGTNVIVDIYGLHHNEHVWEDPENFNPDRFSEGDTPTKGAPWIPFSTGGRQCLGMNFSLVEQRVVLSMLLRKYEWSLPVDSPHREQILTRGTFLVGPKELDIIFKKRY
ncbi:cytochrome P450 [Choanephora cucurbitarum]|nr:cytochrome P450 [Choanephora cucurbitarum]